MHDGFSRRRFMRGAAAGAAVLSGPSFLQACGAAHKPETLATAPDVQVSEANPFDAWFAIDRQVASKVMAALTANGAEAQSSATKYD